MSRHHENVIWQSADGTWSRGFFERTSGFISRDGDDEWDVEYDYDHFQWVSAGHPTAADAAAAWDGPNPGGSTEYTYTDQTAEEIDQFDDMAAVLCEDTVGDRDRWGSPYHGTPKRRTTAHVQSDRDSTVAGWVSSRAGGYDNQLDPFRRLSKLNNDLDVRYQQASAEEKAAFDERDATHRARLRTMLADARQKYHDSSRQDFRYSFSSYDRGFAQKRSDCFTEVETYLDELDAAATKRTTPAPRPAATARAGSARAKTTTKSTPGSFAPRHRDDPGSGVI